MVLKLATVSTKVMTDSTKENAVKAMPPITFLNAAGSVLWVRSRWKSLHRTMIVMTTIPNSQKNSVL
jgi:hypothetical protein